MKDYFTITNEDNMLLMARCPDNYFDLAIVDPPYGIGESKKKRENSKQKWNNPVKKNHVVKNWDSKTPSLQYFEELKRVSKNQIIWGGNYFIDKIKEPSMGWVFWDKKNGDSDFSDGELAYTSFKKGLRKFEWLWSGFQKQKPEKRIHPTQKPEDLYKWLFIHYAKQNDKILDTHLGSGSIAIALDSVNKIEKMNLTLTACELDKDYFKSAIDRIEKNTNWQSLF